MEDVQSLVIRAQKGDLAAFSCLVQRFQNMAYAGAYAMLGDPHLAQDAAQDAFIDAYHSLPNLRQPAAFPGWFRRIVFKHSHRQIRGRRNSAVPLEGVAPVPSPLPSPFAIVAERHLQQSVREAIAALPEGQRLATTLYYLDDYSIREIADFLEISVSAVKKRLYTARKRLKRRMLIMLKDELANTKPSQDEKFARKIRFFVALRAGDLAQIRQLVAADPV